MSVSHKKQIFAIEYAKDLNGARAMRSAGITGVQLRDLLNDDEVRPEVERLLMEKAVAAGIDANTIIRELMDTQKEARANKDYKAAVAALTKIGEQLGMFTPKTQAPVAQFNFGTPTKALPEEAPIEAVGVDVTDESAQPVIEFAVDK